MKRYILLLAIASLSCSTHSTAPVAGPAHPFPWYLKNISVSFRNIPFNETDEGDNGVFYRTAYEVYSGGWSDAGQFTRRGDSLYDPLGGLTLVVQEDSGTIPYLYVGGYAGPYGQAHGGIACQNLQYVSDTGGIVYVALSGRSLIGRLISFSFSRYATFGSINGTETDDYFGYPNLNPNDTPSLTFRFTPQR